MEKAGVFGISNSSGTYAKFPLYQTAYYLVTKRSDNDRQKIENKAQSQGLFFALTNRTRLLQEQYFNKKLKSLLIISDSLFQTANMAKTMALEMSGYIKPLGIDEIRRWFDNYKKKY